MLQEQPKRKKKKKNSAKEQEDDWLGKGSPGVPIVAQW